MSSTTSSLLPSSTRDSTSTHESSNHHVVNIVATIVPVVAIVSMIVWGLLVAGGLVNFRWRSTASQPESTLADSDEKDGADQTEPMMWEVCLKPGMTRSDVLPLAVELRRDKVSIPSRGHTSKPPTIDAKSKWRPTFPASRSDVSLVTKPAQTTVVVMMPTPPPRSLTATVQPEYAIGTRHVVFTEEEGDEDEEEDVVQEKPITADHAALIMDVRLYGYFVA